MPTRRTHSGGSSSRPSTRGSRFSDIVLVEIDDTTFDDLSLQWPFPRSTHGKLIDRLTDEGAEVIAYDVQFTEPTEPREDKALIAAIDRAKKPILVTEETTEDGGTDLLGGDDVVRDVGARAAHSGTTLDPGAVVRRVEHSIGGLDTLAVAIAEEETGRPVPAEPFGEDGAWIDYAGGPGSFEAISFSRALSGDFPPGYFEGKTVIVGAASPSLHDVHAASTSDDALMTGAEIHANAAATVRAGIPLTATSGAFDVALIVLLGMLAPIGSVFLSPRRAFAATLLAGLAFVAGAQLAFGAGWIVPLVSPVFALIVGAVGALVVHYVGAALDRRRVGDLFGRFVPSDIVDRVIASTDGDLRLGAARMDCTVLFADLRDFTGFTENLEPDQVVEILNRYLELMSDAIMDQGGTLVAYMGDGIMAVFGAPIELPDHADRAVAAAREMIGPRLARFNEWIRAEGLGEAFRMGIGLNSGSVMSGNVGSERRIEYTAVGDATNTAARLEAMTKGTEHQVFIADATRAKMSAEPPDFVHVGELEVRGRDEPTRVWALAEPA